MSQGRNPWSDLGCREALELAGRYLVRAVRDAADDEAREGMAWAATLAGIAFGNAGVHLPHAMSYAVSGLVRDFRCPATRTDEPLVPHGISVIVNAPAVFRVHGRDEPGAAPRGRRVARRRRARRHATADAGELLAARLVAMMRGHRRPNGLAGVGYGRGRPRRRSPRGTIVQTRLVDNAPRPVTARGPRPRSSAARSPTGDAR